MGPEKRPKEPQYQIQFDAYKTKGPVCLGPTTSHLWRSDPRHLSFLLARYKIVAKLLSGKKNVLEVGCGDAFAIDIVLQEVKSVMGVDFDPLFIEFAAKLQEGRENCSFKVVDFTIDTVDGQFDAVYALDVIEHINKNAENSFMENICKSLKPKGICILGTPSIESQKYALEWSEAGHVNCKTGSDLKALLLKYFHNAFVFSMNDEMIHLGFYPMAHYLIGIGVDGK
ncbi:MAG: class I SAM-dependent methyltransferase [Candidatus Ratteibacteria bacterium]|jgi:2-polyprenyl-3-methyl-5-hydroxy-6-metoxy-1,4-benzoquinol methylase